MLDLHNADDLKRMLAFIPSVRLKAPRKGEVVDTLVRCLLGADLLELGNRLNPLEQSAVAEGAHEGDGIYDQGAFQAKYRGLPVFETEGKHSWERRPTLIRLFVHPAGNRGKRIPKDLPEKLAAFVPKPPPAQMDSVEQIPAQAPRVRNSRRFNAGKGTTIYASHEAPLAERLTEQAAIQDLRTTLRLIDQEKISVSTKTLLPSRASMTLLCDLLREGDFFELTEKVNDWDPEIGPMMGFSWLLLVQAAKLATLRNGKLSPDEILLIESFADREADHLWSLSESKAIQAIEKGARVGEFRAFLGACDPQPLPEAVEAFLISVEQRGAACVCKGSCLLVECVSPQIAEAIARDPRAGMLCRRTGDRGLVIPVDKEESFRRAINGLGYGMPRV